MSVQVETLRELHALHQRARALRERMASGPKTLAARERALAGRQAAIEQARKALKDARAHNKNREVQLQVVEKRVDDLKIKRNSMSKQHDYDAASTQIAHDEQTRAALEDEILQAFETIEAQAADLTRQEAEVQDLGQEVERLRAEINAQRDSQEAHLRELEAAIQAAEGVIPGDQRDQYLRVVKQRGADAMAAVIREDQRRDLGACAGCYVTITAQMFNELYSADHLVFCKTCGRILYLAEEDESATRRTAR